MAKQREPCNKCRETTNLCPIIVKVHKETRDRECGRPCRVHINGINRFPNVSTEIPTEKPYATKCEKCLEVIRDRDLQLYEMDQEILKIMTDYITFPRSNDNTKGDINHNFKSLQQMEDELFRKEQELAMLKKSACDEVCYNALREKQLEIRWKDFELERQERRQRPNIFQTTKKKIEKIREEHCFTALEKKEQKLLEREWEINDQIEDFRERKYNEEMRRLKAELKWRKKPIPDPPIECDCDCAKYTRAMYREMVRQEKLIRDVYRYYPVGGYVSYWKNNTWDVLKGCIKKTPNVKCRREDYERTSKLIKDTCSLGHIVHRG